MTYLDEGHIDALSPETFRTQHPYPWVSIPAALTQEGFEHLRNAMPQVERFDLKVGVKRGHGQAPHDRYILHYRPGMESAGTLEGICRGTRGRHLSVIAT